MSQSIPTKMTVRGVINDMLELADKSNIPNVQEINNIKTMDTLFEYLKKNYSPREHWLSGVSEEELQHLSEQILGVHYQEFAYKIGIRSNGVLPIIASLAMYMEAGSPFCQD